MALFRCNRCREVYEDYYPPDDTCIKCGKGLIRIVAKREKEEVRYQSEKHV